MPRATFRPIGVGLMLDRSLQVYRALFAPLFLATLAAFGPFYLLSNLLVVNLSALPIVPEFRFDDMDSFWESRFPAEFFEGGAALWAKVAGIVALVAALTLVATPLYVSLVAILTNRALDGEEISLRAALREAWSKYGRVLGNGLLFWLISMGIYLGVSMLNGLVGIFYGGVVVATATELGSAALQTLSGTIVFVIYLVFLYGGTLAYYYFVIRFGYFLPPVLFEGEGVGLGRSWSLTRNGFWRLFAVYLNYGALIYVFSVSLIVVLAGLGASIAGLLLALVVCCAMIPAGVVTYIYTYRVQKARNDADDIAELAERAAEKNGARLSGNEAEGEWKR